MRLGWIIYEKERKILSEELYANEKPERGTNSDDIHVNPDSMELIRDRYERSGSTVIAMPRTEVGYARITEECTKFEHDPNMQLEDLLERARQIEVEEGQIRQVEAKPGERSAQEHLH